jgi:hypothetical protein
LIKAYGRIATWIDNEGSRNQFRRRKKRFFNITPDKNMAPKKNTKSGKETRPGTENPRRGTSGGTSGVPNIHRMNYAGERRGQAVPTEEIAVANDEQMAIQMGENMENLEGGLLLSNEGGQATPVEEIVVVNHGPMVH